MTTTAKPAQRLRLPQRISTTGALYPALAVAILALCVVFHVYRLTRTPGWDPQEGYNLDIAWNLAHGRLRLFALRSDFAQHPPLFYLQLALVIRLLGYNILAVRALAALYAILTCGALLVVGRRLVGDAATLWGAVVFTVAPIMLANTRWGYSYAQLSFVGVLCLGATSQAVARYHAGDAARGGRWFFTAAALAGLAAFSDYEGIAWVAFVTLVALILRTPSTNAAEQPTSWSGWRVRIRRALAPLGVGLAIPIAGLLVCALIAPGLFAADWSQTLGRVSGSGPIVGALSLLLNYYVFVTYDPWLTIGFFGLLFLARPHPQPLPRRERGDREASRVADSEVGALGGEAMAAETPNNETIDLPFPHAVGRGRGLGPGWLLPVALATLGVVTLAARPIGLSFHTATPLLPLLALGVGLALDAAIRIVRTLAPTPGPSPAGRGGVGDQTVQPSPSATNARPRTSPLPVGEGLGVGAALLVFLVVVSPLALAGASDLAGLATTLPTRQDAILATPGDAQAMARYVFAHARSGDLVLASPEVAWMFDQPDPPAPRTEGADILQTLAQTRQAAAFYPAGLPASRWAYPVALARARYVVVDNLLRQLAAPDQLPALIPILHVAEHWPVVYTSGQYAVYAQPGVG